MSRILPARQRNSTKQRSSASLEVKAVAGRRSSLSQTRRLLYGLARLLGDISAASKGPEAMAKRMARRAAGKAVGRVLGKLFK